MPMPHAVGNPDRELCLSLCRVLPLLLCYRILRRTANTSMHGVSFWVVEMMNDGFMSMYGCDCCCRSCGVTSGHTG